MPSHSDIVEKGLSVADVPNPLFSRLVTCSDIVRADVIIVFQRLETREPRTIARLIAPPEATKEA